MACALIVSAQVQTQTSTTAEQATHEVKVERAEVVHVDGNDLVLKMEDGTIRHFPNVSETARATVDGREIGIHDVKVGMKLKKTVTTTTTPKLITTVQSVTGKVWHVTPPSSVILTLEDGTNQKFNIPKDQKFNVDGQMTDAWGLKKGMKISATKVVEEPITSVTVKQQLTGSMPPPPPPPPDVPVLYAQAVVPPPPAAPAAEAPAALPNTGSNLPLIGLLGALALVSSLVLWTLRRAI
jgi:LPXTG-motif cell wall-anchored protein